MVAFKAPGEYGPRMQEVMTPSNSPRRPGRPRSGHVYWHRDHWDIRTRAADGKRGAPQHLAPHVTEQQARSLAAEASAVALSDGGASSPTPALQPSALALVQTEGSDPVAAASEPTGAWVERWFADRNRRGVNGKNDRGAWKKWIARFLDSIPVRDVSRADVERIVEHIDNATLAGEIHGQTPGKIWSLVQAAFRDACTSKTRSLRVRDDNPTEDVAPPDNGEERSRPWLYPCEMVSLMRCARIPVRWRRLFALTTYLYLRAGEVAALTVEDVDLVGGVVLVHRAENRAGRRRTLKRTKTRITHRVPIEPTLRPLLEVMIAEARAEGRARLVVMPPACDLPDQLRAYLPWAGVTRPELTADDETRAPLTFHDLRATGITWRALRGDDVLKIQRAVGHKSLATTQGYIRAAEVIGCDVGAPFPPLPAEILATHLASLETSVGASSGECETSREPPIRIHFGGGKGRVPLPPGY